MTDTLHLTFSGEHIQPIIDGEKRVTARYALEDDRTPRPGESFALVDESGERFADATVDWISPDMTVRQFAEEGWSDHQSYRNVGAFLDQLERYYPDASLAPDTELTVIRFTDVTAVYGYGRQPREPPEEYRADGGQQTAPPAGAAAEIIDGPPASFRILHPVRDHHEHDVDDLARRLTRALNDFPVLAGKTVTVGRDKPGLDRNAAALAWSNVIVVPDDTYVSNVTLYHELAHLAIFWRNHQEDENHPRTSEEYCSIFACAQMPPDRVDEARVPYLGETAVDAEEIPALCQRALEYREDNHDYIQHCRDLLGVGLDAE